MSAAESQGSMISIHALLAESDDCKGSRMDGERSFLSTLSLRRATRVVDGSKSSIEISIHALLAESDILGRVEVV